MEHKPDDRVECMDCSWQGKREELEILKDECKSEVCPECKSRYVVEYNLEAQSDTDHLLQIYDEGEVLLEINNEGLFLGGDKIEGYEEVVERIQEILDIDLEDILVDFLEEEYK